MKRNKILIFCLIIVIATIGVIIFNTIFFDMIFINYDNWKTVSITDVGWIKVPQNWIVREVNGQIYMTDGEKHFEDRENVMLVSVPLLLSENSPVKIVSREEVNGIPISSAVLSNSTEYGTQERISWNGKKVITPFLHFYGEESDVCFLSWDNLVDKDTIYKIAYSFTRQGTVSVNTK